jgi:hypothetical protein
MSGSPTLTELIRARDRDALAGFFDGRAGYVTAYTNELCPAERAQDATLAAFVEFLARVESAAPDVDPDPLLVKAARGCAAARIELRGQPPVCHAAPEVLAASANGELRHGDGALAEHLELCLVCQATAQRLLDAEARLKDPPSEEPPAAIRESWLRVALPPGAEH